MSYQALARKWRPRNFQEMVGQEHVLQALINAISQNRLHHAYLFTGTRGVGKTSIARIFAKSLNCEVGVTATPCGQCVACRQVDEGTFIDLIEIDAASRTKVEDTRELLESVQYVPHRGRYKIYVIDEVHALSNHSFNALLKTLEEPPEHTKFLLATTDPQKIPVTVLSRCLQFHLKHLSPSQITEHLAHVLNEEHIKYDLAAVKKIARAAQGSIRDALSLLDQSIAFCEQDITVEKIDQQLGSIQTIYFYQLMEAICAREAPLVFAAIDQIAQHTHNFEGWLEELLMTLHQIALLQLVPGVSTDFSDPEKLQTWANQITAEEVQLLYQIALIGKRDLPLAPTPQIGFEMVLLRMLFFVKGEADQVTNPPQNSPQIRPCEPTSASEAIQTNYAAKPIEKVSSEKKSEVHQNDEYANILPQLNLTGITKTLASYCTLKEKTDSHIHLFLDESQSLLLNEKQRERFEQALNQFYGVTRKLMISIGTGKTLSPAKLEQTKRTQQHQQAVEKVAQDPKIQAFLQAFDTQLSPEDVTIIE